MSAASFATGVGTLLSTDATFQAALVTLLGTAVTRVIYGTRPWEAIPADQIPCFIVEAAPGEAADISNEGGGIGMSIGKTRQTFTSDIDVALIWREPDRDTAAAERMGLPDLFASLLLRNPQPGGVSDAWLQSFAPDQGTNHPKQAFNATIRGEYAINRTP